MVTGFQMLRRELVLDGHRFGKVGAYEKIVGTIRFSADPENALHRQITDIERAPRNADGKVEFAGDFYLLRPVDGSRGNGSLLFEVANRGRKLALGTFNSAPRLPDPTRPQDFGNGFLMRHGYTVAWTGWQADVPREGGMMALDVPRAKGVTDFVRVELRPHTRANELPLGDRGHIPQPTIDVADCQARLTVRENSGAPIVEIPRADWRFSNSTNVELKGGFNPGAIYNVLYRSADPAILGLGFLAVRDAAAWLRWSPTSCGNPCAGDIDRAYLFGQSQCGRFVREMLYRGLDQDEQERMVFDGAIAHIAGARRGEFNLRFGQPSLNASIAVGTLPPFNDVALYERLGKRLQVPRIFTTNSSNEYWRGDSSLVHTDDEGNLDLDPPEFARNYLMAGTQHTPGPIPPLPADSNTGNRGHNLFNIVDSAPIMRAALRNLDRWIREGCEPPPSMFPRLSDGTAVEPEPLGEFFKAIPCASFPDRFDRPLHIDLGPEVDRGVARYPGKTGKPYRTYVSRLDVNGNEMAGIRLPELEVPLATFAGWNTRNVEQGASGDVMLMMGSTLPFPRTRSERELTGDPRQSIEERYASRAAYLECVRIAAQSLIEQRLVLEEDLESMIQRASLCWDWVHGISTASA